MMTRLSAPIHDHRGASLGAALLVVLTVVRAAIWWLIELLLTADLVGSRGALIAEVTLPPTSAARECARSYAEVTDEDRGPNPSRADTFFHCCDVERSQAATA